MNRQKLTEDSIGNLARLIVGNPSMLACRSEKFGRGMVLFLKASNTDTGRLIGHEKCVYRAINRIGAEIALTDFELIVEEPTQDSAVVETKVWDAKKNEKVLVDVVSSIFNGSSTVRWRQQGQSDLVEVMVQPGYDDDQLQQVTECLRVLFNCIGRAHRRNIRITILS